MATWKQWSSFVKSRYTGALELSVSVVRYTGRYTGALELSVSVVRYTGRYTGALELSVSVVRYTGRYTGALELSVSVVRYTGRYTGALELSVSVVRYTGRYTGALELSVSVVRYGWQIWKRITTWKAGFLCSKYALLCLRKCPGDWDLVYSRHVVCDVMLLTHFTKTLEWSDGFHSLKAKTQHKCPVIRYRLTPLKAPLTPKNQHKNLKWLLFPLPSWIHLIPSSWCCML